ncbi:hypothetical protein [Cytobacillus oceanisediminis]|nr:hypothetical protein [Cytobacillus oceanisediminis]
MRRLNGEELRKGGEVVAINIDEIKMDNTEITMGRADITFETRKDEE